MHLALTPRTGQRDPEGKESVKLEEKCTRSARITLGSPSPWLSTDRYTHLVLSTILVCVLILEPVPKPGFLPWGLGQQRKVIRREGRLLIGFNTERRLRRAWAGTVWPQVPAGAKGRRDGGRKRRTGVAALWVPVETQPEDTRITSRPPEPGDRRCDHGGPRGCRCLCCCCCCRTERTQLWGDQEQQRRCRHITGQQGQLVSPSRACCSKHAGPVSPAVAHCCGGTPGCGGGAPAERGPPRRAPAVHLRTEAVVCPGDGRSTVRTGSASRGESLQLKDGRLFPRGRFRFLPPRPCKSSTALDPHPHGVSSRPPRGSGDGFS